MNKAYRDWLSKRLKSFRKEKKYTQELIASIIGKKRCTYASYEEARAEPSIGTLQRICKEYETTLDKFFETCPTSLVDC